MSCACQTTFFAGIKTDTYCEEHEPYVPTGRQLSYAEIAYISRKNIEKMAADTFFKGLEDGRKHLVQ